MQAEAAAFCPHCLAFVEHLHEVNLERPNVLWSRCQACGRISVWNSGELDFPVHHGVAVSPVHASVYFRLSRAAAGERLPAAARRSAHRVALRDAQFQMADIATFLARYLAYQHEEGDTPMTDESVLERAMRDQRETNERIEALRQQIAQQERHISDIDAFVEVYRRYAGMSEGSLTPQA